MYEEGYRPHEMKRIRLRDALLIRQVQSRREWRRVRQMIGLRNDIRGLMGADLIKTGQPERDEEAIEEFLDNWSGWIEQHTN